MPPLTPLAASAQRPHPQQGEKGRFAPLAPAQKAAWLATLQEQAAARGGRLLSPEYLGNGEKLLWQCEAGHRWLAAPFAILHGSWCKACYHERLRKGFARIEAEAARRGGQCLSAAGGFRTVEDRLEWRCAAGHTWQAKASKVLEGSWCPECARESLRLGLAKMQEAARAHGGECLSGQYRNSATPLEWRCAHGHAFRLCADRIAQGDWCPACAKEARLQRRLAEMREIAASRGGRCLSDAYERSTRKLLWQCHLGHVWQARPVCVKAGTWCPECSRLQQCRHPEAREKYLPARAPKT